MMKNVLICIFLILLSTLNTYSHKQHVHQYICVQAYDLLKSYLGGDIPYMQSHLGGTTPFYVGDRPWQRHTITTGAWREDEEDIVWGYGNLLPIDAYPFDRLDCWTSITHFWDADNGDNSDNYFRIKQLGIVADYGPFPNAYTKLLKFAYPNYSWTLKYYDGYHGHEWTFALASGGTQTMERLKNSIPEKPYV